MRDAGETPPPAVATPPSRQAGAPRGGSVGRRDSPPSPLLRQFTYGVGVEPPRRGGGGGSRGSVGSNGGGTTTSSRSGSAGSAGSAGRDGDSAALLALSPVRVDGGGGGRRRGGGQAAPIPPRSGGYVDASTSMSLPPALAASVLCAPRSSLGMDVPPRVATPAVGEAKGGGGGRFTLSSAGGTAERRLAREAGGDGGGGGRDGAVRSAVEAPTPAPTPVRRSGTLRATSPPPQRPRSAPRLAPCGASLPPPARPLTGFLTRLADEKSTRTAGAPPSRPAAGGVAQSPPPPSLGALLRAVHTALTVTAGSPSAASLRSLLSAVLAALRRLVVAAAAAARPVASAVAAATATVAASVIARTHRGGTWSVTLGRAGVTLVVAPVPGGGGVRPSVGAGKARPVEEDADPHAPSWGVGGGPAAAAYRPASGGYLP